MISRFIGGYQGGQSRMSVRAHGEKLDGINGRKPILPVIVNRRTNGEARRNSRSFRNSTGESNNRTRARDDGATTG
jgi:hypothetical protein